ncbi:hypothetical protein MRX96_018463 [Rhipicephalus microplus]
MRSYSDLLRVRTLTSCVAPRKNQLCCLKLDRERQRFRERVMKDYPNLFRDLPTRDSEVPRTPDQDYNDSAGSFTPVTDPVEPDITADSTSDTKPVRRSLRARCPPKFLSYDKQFKQIFEMQC